MIGTVSLRIYFMEAKKGHYVLNHEPRNLKNSEFCENSENLHLCNNLKLSMHH